MRLSPLQKLCIEMHLYGVNFGEYDTRHRKHNLFRFSLFSYRAVINKFKGIKQADDKQFPFAQFKDEIKKIALGENFNLQTLTTDIAKRYTNKSDQPKSVLWKKFRKLLIKAKSQHIKKLPNDRADLFNKLVANKTKLEALTSKKTTENLLQHNRQAEACLTNYYTLSKWVVNAPIADNHTASKSKTSTLATTSTDPATPTAPLPIHEAIQAFNTSGGADVTPIKIKLVAPKEHAALLQFSRRYHNLYNRSLFKNPFSTMKKRLNGVITMQQVNKHSKDKTHRNGRNTRTQDVNFELTSDEKNTFVLEFRDRYQEKYSGTFFHNPLSGMLWKLKKNSILTEKDIKDYATKKPKSRTAEVLTEMNISFTN